MIEGNNSEEISPHKAPDRAQLELIAAMFKAFADPTRLLLMQALRTGTKNVGQLVEELKLNQANVSKHLQILHDARILSREKRGTATFYSIDDHFIYPLCDLVCKKINRDQSRIESVNFAAADYSI